MDNRAIGVFDSGLGGLTVLNEITNILKNEKIVYFGDSGRAPYGTKSKEIVLKYTIQDINFLQSQDVKMIVIACNTASACSLDVVKSKFNIPIVEVVGPGATTAVRETRSKRVGVIGTSATINSKVYEKAIKRIDSSIEVFSKACPLFVPLVEEGWWDNDITLRIVEEYLVELKEHDIDTLVLGCTHYPLLQKTIATVMGDGVKLVSSASEVAKVVKEVIEKMDYLRDDVTKPYYRFYTSDSVEKFETLGSAILGHKINSLEKIDIERY